MFILKKGLEVLIKLFSNIRFISTLNNSSLEKLWSHTISIELYTKYLSVEFYMYKSFLTTTLSLDLTSVI